MKNRIIDILQDSDKYTNKSINRKARMLKKNIWWSQMRGKKLHTSGFDSSWLYILAWERYIKEHIKWDHPAWRHVAAKLQQLYFTVSWDVLINQQPHIRINYTQTFMDGMQIVHHGYRSEGILQYTGRYRLVSQLPCQQWGKKTASLWMKRSLRTVCPRHLKESVSTGLL